MNRFPRYGPPFQYYNPYQRNNFYSHQQPTISEEKNNINSHDDRRIKQNNTKKIDSKNTVWFDLFGIKLYFDDVLILSLLFFLYKEEVKDEGLFLALVLLLIS